jgi:hypothetical protein
MIFLNKYKENGNLAFKGALLINPSATEMLHSLRCLWIWCFITLKHIYANNCVIFITITTDIPLKWWRTEDRHLVLEGQERLSLVAKIPWIITVGNL